MTDRELMQQALEALEFHVKNADEIEEIDLVLVTVLRERLAQPEQEPVAWMNKHGACMSAVFKEVGATGGEYTTPLYTTPPQRKPLTDEEIDKLPWGPHEGNPVTFAEGLRDFARAIEQAHGIDAIEAKLKEKNT